MDKGPRAGAVGLIFDCRPRINITNTTGTTPPVPAKLVTLISELKETRAGDIWALNYIIALVYQLVIRDPLGRSLRADDSLSRICVVSPG